MRVGIVFMGRWAPGSHNVVAGLRRSLAAGSQILGFLNGAQGLINSHFRELSETEINSGGNRILGRSENPIRTRHELHACVTTCKKLRLQGLVVVGGLGTHADTALLAEAVAAHRLPTRVLGVPASIENDIPLVEQSLGHDTACRVYSSIVGSLALLAASKKRQWCFVRISGKRSSMLITELALQTHANLVLTAEELAARRMSLADVVNLICDLISLRAKNGADFGTVIFSESVLDQVVREKKIPSPPEILLESFVGEELQRRRSIGCCSSSPSVFRSSTHVLSHSQGRNSYPSNFDCDLGFTLGLFAGILINNDKTALLVSVENLAGLNVAQDWEPLGVPLTSLLQIHLDKESLECSMYIQQREADFQVLEKQLPAPALRRFLNPGPLQFRDNLRLKSLTINSPQLVRQRILVEKVSALCSQIMSISSSASDQRVRDVLNTGLAHTLALMKAGNPNFFENHPGPNDARKGAASHDLLRPGNDSHNRVIQLVPVDR
jgi:6-phosphofructokinase